MPMKLRKTSFFPAMRRSSARVSCSPRGGSRASGRAERMAAGTGASPAGGRRATAGDGHHAAPHPPPRRGGGEEQRARDVDAVGFEQLVLGEQDPQAVGGEGDGIGGLVGRRGG